MRPNDKILRRVLKPGRYTGGEFGQIIKDKTAVKARFAFCFPDTYEIGMSNLGVRILYGALNAEPDIWCERAYAPWVDMEEQMRAEHIPLWAHESGDELRDFDIVAFTLQYELCYTNVLNMLELSGIPLLHGERSDSDPIIMGGGPCAYNPEPAADFFDLFSIGEGEEHLVELTKLLIKMKGNGGFSRAAYLREAAKVPGTYVPSLYDVSYNPDGTIARVTPKNGAPIRVRKRIIADMDAAFYPEKLVLPYIETVQDRTVLEVYRGCIRGCRFCQAGMIFRPVREKTPERLDTLAHTLCDATGYDEISLSSLSISDYSRIGELTDRLLGWTDKRMINLSLPSLRVDSFTDELMEKISSVRNSGITFAPEAGTQRLRDVINKKLTEDDLIRAVTVAFNHGKNSVKLYFMTGHPTETYEDLDGIALLAKHVLDAYYQNPNRRRGVHPTVSISAACFIPKPFTPFQWEAQDEIAVQREKQQYLRNKLREAGRGVSFHWHDPETSMIEAIFARGDRRLSAALLEARKRGLRFDAWDEHFSFAKWSEIFAELGIDPEFYATRERGTDEILPWEVIDCGVTREFFLRERRKAYNAEQSLNCREGCEGCGADSLGGVRRCCGNN